MNKSLIFICLFALYLSTYKPMTDRSINFGKDVCYYRDVSHNSYFEYVKPCESGKTCLSLSDSNYNIRKCQDYNYLYRTLNDECQIDEDCPGNLKCKSNKCDFDGDNPYLNYYCPYGKVIDGGVCKEKTNGDKCELRDDNGNYQEGYNAGYFKLCGLIDLKTLNNNGDYFKKSVSSSFYCSVADGNFVDDEFACQSGFALYFYGNNKYTQANNPSSTSNIMYLKCVTVTGIDADNKVVKYKIGEAGVEQYYLINKLISSYQSYILGEISEFTMTKLELFQNYKKRYDAIKDDCQKLLYPDEEETCRDDELRKWYYFYLNPEQYVLYKNEPQIMEYLVQKTYKNYKAEHTSYSRFLSLNIFIMLLFFISL